MHSPEIMEEESYTSVSGKKILELKVAQIQLSNLH